MPYLDSNVFIYSIVYDPEVEPKAKRAKDLLLNVENGKTVAYTSTLTWDEVVWIVSKTMGRREGLLQGQKLLEFPNINFVVADENVLSRAQRLINRYNMSPRDSIHAASALEKRTRAVISDDADFDQVKEIKRTPI